MINVELLLNSLPALLNGAAASLKIMFIALSVGVFLGTILGVIQTYAHAIFGFFVSVYVGIIRGTPQLIQITFFYYVLPMMGISLSGFMTAALALGINSSAYVSQIIRSGIKAVGKDQQEAAKVLGFTPLQTIWYIVLPQAVRYVLPALANEGMTLVKDTSLAYVIGVTELYKEARSIISQSYDVFTVFLMVTVLYLIMTSCISGIAYLLDQRMNRHA